MGLVSPYETHSGIRVLTKEGMDYLRLRFSSTKKVVIFGKGPTFRVPEREPNETWFCINDALLEMPDEGRYVFQFNDLEALARVKEADSSIFSRIDLIITPFRPHVQEGRSKSTLENIISILAPVYNGDLLVHNLHTSPPDRRFVTFGIMWNSALVVASVITNVFPSHTSVTTYGIANGNGSHSSFASSFGSDEVWNCIQFA